MRRILPTVITVVVLAGLIKLFRIVQQYDPALNHGAGQAPDISVQLTGATLLSRRAGKPEWTMQADRIDMRPQGSEGLESFRSAEFRGIHSGVLYKDGREEVTFSARGATYEQASQKFEISGGLRIRDRKGDDVQADECQWSEREDFI